MEPTRAAEADQRDSADSSLREFSLFGLEASLLTDRFGSVHCEWDFGIANSGRLMLCREQLSWVIGCINIFF